MEVSIFHTTITVYELNFELKCILNYIQLWNCWFNNNKPETNIWVVFISHHHTRCTLSYEPILIICVAHHQFELNFCQIFYFWTSYFLKFWSLYLLYQESRYFSFFFEDLILFVNAYVHGISTLTLRFGAY